MRSSQKNFQRFFSHLLRTQKTCDKNCLIHPDITSGLKLMTRELRIIY